MILDDLHVSCRLSVFHVSLALELIWDSFDFLTMLFFVQEFHGRSEGILPAKCREQVEMKSSTKHLDHK